MDAATLKGVLDGVQQGAIALAALATLAGWWVGRQVERQKEKKDEARQEEERRSREELLANTKEIRERLAALYPGVPPAEALRRLEEELGKVRELAQRRDYQAPTPSVRASVVARLRSVTSLAPTSGLKVRVFVAAKGHDENRDRLVNDIAQVLSEAGISASVGAPSLSIGGPAFPPLSVCFRPEHEAAARGLLAALEGYLGGQLAVSRDDKCPADEILLRVSGTPAFGRDGTVKVE